MNFIKNLTFKFFVLFLLLFLHTSNAQSAASPVEFFGAQAFGNGGPVYYLVKDGDFNGDGKIDLLGSNYNSIFVIFGDGTEKFTAPPVVVYTFTSDLPIIPAAGDFNGDGRTDIALTSRLLNQNTPAIGVYFGNADKTFSQPLYSSFSAAGHSLYPVDFDNDGQLDLLGDVGNSIVFFKGNMGAFTNGGRLMTTFTPSAVLIGDLNNDNLPDVAYSDSSDLKVSQNLGNGAFGTPVTVSTIDYEFASGAIADFNNDGKKDLVAVQYNSFNPTVRILLGNNNFTFTPAPDFIVRSREHVYLQAVADLDKDQKMDLIFSSTNRTIVSQGNGNGTFQIALPYIDGGGSLFVRDIDSDGWLDIVAGQSVEFGGLGAGSVAVLLNLQNGRLKSGAAIPTGEGTKDIAVTDFNADQLKDFVVINRDSGGAPGDILVFFQFAIPRTETAKTAFTSGESVFQRTSVSLASAAAGSGIDPYGVVTGDFNGDGKKDIVVAGNGAFGSSQNSALLINNGNNGFTESLFQIGTGIIYDIGTADFNNDGRLDLVTIGSTGTKISFGTGAGTFIDSGTYLPDPANNQLTIGDFNNDSKPDIAVIGSKIGILLNSGTGTFTNPANITTPAGLAGIVAADMNFDGKVDLIVGKSNGVSILTGNGNGSFNPEVTYPITAVFATGVTVSDFNGDGKPDVALLGGSNSVTVLLNNGAGGLGRETLWGGGTNLSAIVAEDFNNDQKTDLIVGFSNSYDGYTKFLINTTTATPPATRAGVFDFDGDGKTDISIFRPADGSWWYSRSLDNAFRVYTFGVSSDIMTPGDFTGDGKTDIAVWRPSTGEWFVQRSEDNSYFSLPFGIAGDIPVPLDYDGDGKTDLAVFRPSTGTWYIQNSSGSGTSIVGFGISEDKPVAADYDGDGKADIAIFRPSDGSWWYLRSSDAQFRVFRFGVSTDKPVQGDWTGDGKADIAVFRPSTGEWFVQRSEDNSFYSVPFGTTGDLPAPGDYDGDGKYDTAVFRPSGSTWFVNRSTAGILITNFGAAGDKPVPNAFVP